MVLAAGVLDGHGSRADESNLADLVPDAAQRERVLQVAAQMMRHAEFKAVRTRSAGVSSSPT